MAREDMGPTPFDMQEFMAIFSYIGMGFAIIWGWALPVFFLLWFRREVIRAEIAGWSNQATANRDVAADVRTVEGSG
jgi:hypothetical protein